MKRLASYAAPPLEFQIFRKNILHFTSEMCRSNWSSGAYPLNQGHMT